MRNRNNNPGRETLAFSVFRVGVGVAAVVLLVALFPRVSGLGSGAVYVATWITLLHLCVGEYVLVRFLHARSRVQHALDLMAAVFVLGAVLSFPSTALWCAFLGGVFAIAVTKYLLVERSAQQEELARYAREKVRWESPAVVGFAILAVVLDQLPEGSTASVVVEIALLVASALFAVWMIGIRHIYRSLARQAADRDAPGERNTAEGQS
jgi:hypothetical protein